MVNQKDVELESLLLRIAAGDETALRSLIVQYSPILGPYIFKFTHSKEQAEEILQDVFIQVWQLRESLSTIQNFNVFVYVMAKNYALNALRTTMREYQRREKWQGLQTDTTTPDDERLNLLEEAIRQLPGQQQQAWLLSRREGMKHADIAREMNVTKETVKKHIQRANAFITAYVLERADLLLLGALLASGVR